MSEVDNQHSPPLRGCIVCTQVIRQLIVQGLVHSDDEAWIPIAQHFSNIVKSLIASSPYDCRQDVQSEVMYRMYVTLTRLDVYTVPNLHAYVHTAMRNAKLTVLRRRSTRLKRETALDPSWDVESQDPSEDGTHLVKQRGTYEVAARRCLDALNEAKEDEKNTALDVMCLDVIEAIFLADLDGERIDRGEACRRLGLTEEKQRISEKLSRIRYAESSHLHSVIKNIDSMLFTSLERRVAPKEDN